MYVCVHMYVCTCVHVCARVFVHVHARPLLRPFKPNQVNWTYTGSRLIPTKENKGVYDGKKCFNDNKTEHFINYEVDAVCCGGAFETINFSLINFAWAIATEYTGV